MCAGTGDCGTRRRNVYRRIDLRDRSPRYIPLKGKEKDGDGARESPRDRRVPGPRPASLPVTRRESRRPARKRPVGISIFLRPFPLPRRAAPRNTAPSRRLVGERGVRFFRAVPRDRARERRNEEVTIAKASLRNGFRSRDSLSFGEITMNFRTRKNAFPSSFPGSIPETVKYRERILI